MKLKTWTGAVAVALVGLTASLAAAAPFDKPEDAIRYRRAAYTLLGAHLTRIGDVVKGKTPYGPEVAADAKVLEVVSHLPFAAFVDGSDAGDTRARPDVWKDRAKFDQLAKAMQEKVAELSRVAASGDESALRGAFGEAGKSCKNCHDSFRNK